MTESEPEPEPELPATAWGPLSALPLPAGAADLLRSLSPRRGRGPGRRSPRRSLAEAYSSVGQDAVRDWLGFDPPTLPSLVSPDVEEHFVVPGSGHPPRREVIDRGDGAWVGVLYAPKDLDWSATPLTAQRVLGLTVLSLGVGEGVPFPDWVPRTRRDRACGDATTVDLHGTPIGVQHQEPGWTRLAWVRRGPGVVSNVIVYAALGPLPAVELLVRDRDSVLR